MLQRDVMSGRSGHGDHRWWHRRHEYPVPPGQDGRREVRAAGEDRADGRLHLARREYDVARRECDVARRAYDVACREYDMARLEGIVALMSA